MKKNPKSDDEEKTFNLFLEKFISEGDGIK